MREISDAITFQFWFSAENRRTKTLYIYTLDTPANAAGWCGYLLPVENTPVTHNPISLGRSFYSNKGVTGHYLFAEQKPQLDDEDKRAFILSIAGLLDGKHLAKNERALVWIKDIQSERRSIHDYILFDNGTYNPAADKKCFNVVDGNDELKRLRVSIGANLSLRMNAGTNPCTIAIGPDGHSLSISEKRTGTPPAFFKSIPEGNHGLSITSALTLPLIGSLTGCITFDGTVALPRHSSDLRCGMRYVRGADLNVQYYPMLAPEEGDNTFNFQASIDPLDPTNLKRWQTDPDQRRIRSRLILNPARDCPSWLRTATNNPITLTPLPSEEEDLDWPDADAGALVFEQDPNPGADPNVYITLAGRFGMKVDTGVMPQLLCGLSGTETIGFKPLTDGNEPFDVLRFVIKQPAYVPVFPLPQASPIAPPMNPDAPLLDDVWQTSWISMHRPAGVKGMNPYVAQPTGAPMYGYDSIVHSKGNGLLGHRTPAIMLPKQHLVYPLVPYAGVTLNGQSDSAADTEGTSPALVTTLEAFESQVIAATRRRQISEVEDHNQELGGIAKYTVATPTGRIFKLEGPSENPGTSVEAPTRWTKILLGQVDGQNSEYAAVQANPDQEVCFIDPDQKLQQAFATSDLFLVAASTEHLGAEFRNELEIGGWQLKAAVGQKNSYADYRNVLIIKGRKGALYTPREASNDVSEAQDQGLVSSPSKWTQAGDFAPADPTNGQTPDPGQLTSLSQWLVDYFEHASMQQDSEYFRKFNRLATDPDWTGVLMLKVDIKKVPEDLAGIIAGVDDMDQFCAHHLGIEMNQVENGNSCGPSLKHSSSIFGLIHYNDPQFQPPNADDPAKPIPPKAGAIYDFRLLALSVLFANTKVKSFQSFAQVTLGELFSMPVTKVVGVKTTSPQDASEEYPHYRSIVLRGTYQNNNGKPVYSLASAGDSLFQFESNIFNKIEVARAQMSTRCAGQLFDLDSNLKADLNGGIVTDGLKDAFASHGITLSTDGVIKVDAEDQRWHIVPDAGRQNSPKYLILNENHESQLGVYLAVSWFGLRGFLDFKVIEAPVQDDCSVDRDYVKTELAPFDIFSFGSSSDTSATETSRQGLSVFNIGLEMSYPPDRPEDKTFRFVTSDIRFDLASSTPRKDSLFLDFALEFEDFVEATAEETAVSLGYTTVIPDAKLDGVEGAPWYGLRYRLDMGTPGALAGKVGLTSHVLLAWSPDSKGNNCKALIGIQLPGTGSGASLISLQTIMKLSIGQIRLAFDRTKNSFLLMMTEIALKFLGILKIPPAGSTLFYLFGNPDSDTTPGSLGWYAMYSKTDNEQNLGDGAAVPTVAAGEKGATR